MGYTVHLGGDTGIKKPVDINGTTLKEGDKLTWDYGDSENIKSWMQEPIFIIKTNKNGGFFGEGIDKDLFLHDFRFEYARKM